VRQRRRFKKGRDDDKIVVNIKADGEMTTYVAQYEELEFEGITVGDESEVREVLARMLSQNKDLPDSLKSLVALMTGYVELMVNQGVRYVTTSAGLEANEDCDVGLKVNIFYTDGEGDGEEDVAYKGWAITLKAVYDGFDGYTFDASHEVKKRLRPGEKIDFDALRTELTNLAKIAYNAHRSSRWWLSRSGYL